MCERNRVKGLAMGRVGFGFMQTTITTHRCSTNVARCGSRSHGPRGTTNGSSPNSHPSHAYLTQSFAHPAKPSNPVDGIECVGRLHPRQTLAINAATHSSHTFLTLTYDPARFTATDITQLTQLFSQQIAQARQELS